MKFDELLSLSEREAVFETGFLLAGAVDPKDVRRQLSRWTASGRIQQLRRGLYALSPPYRHLDPHPFVVANHMVRGSYVSLQSALEFHGLIPERTARVISVGSTRPRSWQTPLGTFEFRCLRPELMVDFSRLPLISDQSAFVASPEKALLDLVYLQAGGDDPAYLRGLRLQNLETLDLERLHALAHRIGKPKLRRAVKVLDQMARHEAAEYEDL